MEPQVCALDGCDEKFVPKRKTQLYCTIKHAQAASNANRSSGALRVRKCAWCGDEFQQTTAAQRFCRRSHTEAFSRAGGRSKADIEQAEDAEAAAPELEDADLIRLAEERGYRIHRPEPPSEPSVFDTSRIKGERIKVAIASDTHWGSKYQQLTYFREFIAYAKKQKVQAFIHGGDMTDGPPQMHPGHLQNIFLHTYEAQRSYGIDQLPEVGVPWYVISGNHDESWLKNNAGPIVEDIAAVRPDVNFVGASSGYIRFGDVLVYVGHPHDGGSYALSYKAQKRTEAFSPDAKPHIMLLGNYHKALHLPAYRNVEGFLLPSFQSQTPFMVGKGLASIIGGVILEFGLEVGKGLSPSLKTEWVLFREPLSHDWS